MNSKIKPLILALFIITINFVVLSGSVQASGQVKITLSCPFNVYEEDSFDLLVKAEGLIEFDASNFDIEFDDSIVTVTGVSNGLINDTEIPVSVWDIVDTGKLRAIVNMPGIPGVNGSGYLAVIHCLADEPGVSNFNLSKCVISDIYANKIDLVFEMNSTEVVEKDQGGTSGAGNPGGSGVTITNKAPIADASSEEPYSGLVEEEIVFNGSLSYDLDSNDYIERWYWDFDDGTNGSGEIISHIFTEPGSYHVKLSVWDNHEKKCVTEYITSVEILKPNLPPSQPEISGTINGKVNEQYQYTVVSYDEDGDNLSYNASFGDNTYSESNFTEQSKQVNFIHVWKNPGEYKIKVSSYDGLTKSQSAELHVFIDVILIDNTIKGYLVDTDSNGVYDKFEDYDTGNRTNVKQEDTNSYLIDEDGDDLFDSIYGTISGSLSKYTKNPDGPGINTSLILIIAIFLCISIVSILFWKKR